MNDIRRLARLTPGLELNSIPATCMCAFAALQTEKPLVWLRVLARSMRRLVILLPGGLSCGQFAKQMLELTERVVWYREDKQCF